MLQFYEVASGFVPPANALPPGRLAACVMP